MAWTHRHGVPRQNTDRLHHWILRQGQPKKSIHRNVGRSERIPQTQSRKKIIRLICEKSLRKSRQNRPLNIMYKQSSSKFLPKIRFLQDKEDEQLLPVRKRCLQTETLPQKKTTINKLRWNSYLKSRKSRATKAIELNNFKYRLDFIIIKIMKNIN